MKQIGKELNRSRRQTRIYFSLTNTAKEWHKHCSFLYFDMWRECKTKFLNVVDTLRTKRVRSKRSPWITSELKKRVHERDIMKLKAVGSKKPHDWGGFKRLRNKVNIRIVKESYYKQSFTENKNDSRRTWQTINELSSRKSNTPSIKELIVNGVSINESTDLEYALMVFKSLNGLAPEYQSSKYIAQSHTTSYIFRDSVKKLTIPQPRANYLHKSFRYNGAVLWNSRVLKYLGKQNLYVILSLCYTFVTKLL